MLHWFQKILDCSISDIKFSDKEVRTIFSDFRQISDKILDIIKKLELISDI